MPYKLLWVLLEGDDDERFFNRVIKPILNPAYLSVNTWKYAQEKTEKTKNFLISISKMSSDYFFWADINQSACVTTKKQTVLRRYRNAISTDNIVIVVKEIESWYIAGVDNKGCQELSLKSLQNTDDITKENFNQLVPKKFGSRRTYFMLEILKKFDINIAKRKNKSFKHFMNKIESIHSD